MEPNESFKKDLQSEIDSQMGKTEPTLNKVDTLNNSPVSEPPVKDLPNTDLQKELSGVQSIPAVQSADLNSASHKVAQEGSVDGSEVSKVNNIVETKTNSIAQTVSNSAPTASPTNTAPDNLPPLQSSVTMNTFQNTPSKKPGIIPTHPEKAPAENSVPETPKVSTPADDVQLNTLRTYKADISSTVNKDKITTAKVLMAEQKKKEKEEAVHNKTSIENPVNKFKLGLSAIFISVAIIAVLFGTFLFLTPEPEPDDQQAFVDQNELSFDSKKTFLITGKSTNDIQTEIQNFLNFSYKENTINELVLYTEKQEEDTLVAKKLSATGLFTVLGFDPPQTFTRNLSNEYIFGIYTLNSDNKEFLLFKVEDFGNVYNSIFDYEQNMISQMRQLFGGFEEFDLLAELKRRKIDEMPDPLATSTATTTEEIPAVATSTATSTEPIQEINIDEEIASLTSKVQSYSNFIDVILQNNDARAILTPEGEIQFYYAFIDDKWLLISDDTEVLRELKRRIREKNLVR